MLRTLILSGVVLLGVGALWIGACGESEDPAYCEQLRAGGYRDAECGERTGCAVDGCPKCQFCYTDVVCPDPAVGGSCTCEGDRACHDLCASDADCPSGQSCTSLDLYYGTHLTDDQVRFCQ